jgi:hypothetical protein
MASMSLSRKNVSRLLEMLEERYGDSTLSELQAAIKRDESISGIKIVTARSVYGKKATFVKTHMGVVSRPLSDEWKMLD